MTGAADLHPPSRLDDAVRISLPRRYEYVRILRLVASGYAATLGLDIDEIEDVRIAVDELASLLVEQGSGPEVHLEIRCRADHLEFVGSTTGNVPLVIDLLTDQILGAVTRHYAVDVDHASVRFQCEISIPKR